MNDQTNLQWYQKPVTVIIFLILFFPVGLYLMWKHDLWNKTTRIIISVIFGLLLVANMNKTDSNKGDVINSYEVRNQKVCSESSHIQYVKEHFINTGNDVYGISTLGNNNCGYIFVVNGYNQSKGLGYTCTVKTDGSNGIEIIDAACDYNSY